MKQAIWDPKTLYEFNGTNFELSAANNEVLECHIHCVTYKTLLLVCYSFVY